MSNPKAVQVTLEGEVFLSGAELADIFWAMVETDQIDFFRQLYHVSAGSLPMQLQAVIDHHSFDLQSKLAMQAIGEYGEAGP